MALHGCTQNATDFALGTRFDDVAETMGAYVLYPQQSSRLNARRCWNWFLPENQERIGPEPAAILAMIGDVIAAHPIDRNRVCVAGMSAGGAMAAILAEQAPEIFCGVGIVAGVPLHAARGINEGMRQMHTPLAASIDSPLIGKLLFAPGRFQRTRVQIWTGDNDHTVHPDNALALAEQFRVLLRIARPPLRTMDGRGVITRWFDEKGHIRIELRVVQGLGHRWSGGSMRGSHTQASGPDISSTMLPFLLAAPRYAEHSSEFGT